MRRIGTTNHARRISTHGRVVPILLASVWLTAACSPGDASAPETVDVKRSAVTFLAPTFPISELPMEVKNVNSGKCLEVADLGTANGAKVQQNTCNGGPHQTFFFTPAGPTSYQIRAGHTVGKNLDVAGASLNNNALIQLYDAVSYGAGEIFKLAVQADGSFEIRSQNSGKCVDVAGGSVADKAIVQQYDCIGVANERWILTERSIGLNLIAAHSGKCLNVPGVSTADGAAVQQNTCAQQPNQAWSLGNRTTVNGVTYYTLIANHSGKCLDVPGGSTADGAVLQQYACGSLVTNLFWSLTENQYGSLSIVNRNSGKCLNVATTDEGDVAVQSICNSIVTSQRWYASIFASRHIQFVQVAQSSGANRLTQPDAAIADNVTRLTGIYGRKGLSLTYDAAADKSNVDSDALFNLGGSGTYTCPDGTAGTPDVCATRYAEKWPDKVVIFSRPGADFASHTANFIALGQLGASTPPVCGDVPNTQWLGHMFGHYMGLLTTFDGDGDLLSDTLPDPHVDACLEPHLVSGTYNNAVVSTNNIMSNYYNVTPVVTRMQAAQTRAAAYVRRTECGGPAQLACASDAQFCERPPGCATPKPMGSCTLKAFDCSLQSDPVCGCDGKSYTNDCQRKAAGVNLWTTGLCSSATCPAQSPQAGTSCSPGGMSCVFAQPPSCVQRFSCTNGVWSAPTVVCDG